MPVPALAQASSDVATLRSEIARLRAEMAGMEARLNQIEKSDIAAESTTTPAVILAPAQVAAAQVTTKTAVQSADTRISWKGAPQFAKGDSLTFKPRGRLQLDTNNVSRPAGINSPTLGWSSDVRRAYLGAEGKLGGGFGYRLEADFASGNALMTDAWLTYDKGPLTVTIGNHRITTLEELTSDLETTLLERSPFMLAFGMERRLGVSVAYNKGDIVFTAGAFSDDLVTLGSGIADNSYSLDTRLVYKPKFGDTQLHLGGSFHHRELNDLASALRYNVRPGARSTDARFVDTGLFSASAETGYGVEFAAINGPFHVTGESFWQRVARPGLAAPTFFGTYGEIGYVFAGGAVRGYKDGTFTAIRPTRGMDNGGAGAWQINLRLDWLDLNDAAVVGGQQRNWGASLVWVPVERVKFLANYVRVEVTDTPVLAGNRRDYSSNVMGLRAQYDF